MQKSMQEFTNWEESVSETLVETLFETMILLD